MGTPNFTDLIIVADEDGENTCTKILPQDETSANTLTSPLDSRGKKRKGSKMQIVEARMEDAYKMMKNMCEIPVKDECLQYAELVATKLRAFDGNTRDILMHEIDNLLFRAKMQQRHQSVQPLPSTSFFGYSHDLTYSNPYPYLPPQSRHSSQPAPTCFNPFPSPSQPHYPQSQPAPEYFNVSPILSQSHSLLSQPSSEYSNPSLTLSQSHSPQSQPSPAYSNSSPTLLQSLPLQSQPSPASSNPLATLPQSHPLHSQSSPAYFSYISSTLSQPHSSRTQHLSSCQPTTVGNTSNAGTNNADNRLEMNNYLNASFK